VNNISVGSIVRCRNREWVVLPSLDENLYLLRPLTGSEKEICGIDKRLANLLPQERVEPAVFPLPKPEDSGTFIGTGLLWNAARLSLRSGTGPFRSFGRISVRPRAYQLVPLLMSLRLDSIRLLIADDVGIGKTIEALLIARELLDRGEITRICVLCPPYLCDQWQQELSEKFHIDAVVIRSGTISGLERDLPSADHSVFRYYPHTVVSIDYAKFHKAQFLVHCPDFVIIDEAHGAALPSLQSRSQQQRHELLKDLASSANRHLLLITATPHSGVEQSFLSLLGLLRGDFARLDLERISDRDRDDLARHFVQRRRADIANVIGEETKFPKRDSIEETYALSASYRILFDKVFQFSSELVRSGETLSGWKKRIRYWTALALLRCVMSSPAAAQAALRERAKRLFGAESETTDDDYSSFIYEGSEEASIDVQPGHIIDEGESDIGDSEKRKLREFARLAEGLKESADTKLLKCVDIIRRLMKKGFHPIIWCRYIATSDYLARELTKRLEKEVSDFRAISVTGALAEEERRVKVKELEKCGHRVLVATDCLSEGINLQDHFTAVVHYDLPWNPNRLEQREGRVDRFGQRAEEVKAVILYGSDNPVDGAVLDVLIRKAKEIRKSLGITVPVPADSETVMQAVLKALFFRRGEARQMQLFEEGGVNEFHAKWDRSVDREKVSRTRFAQRAIKPEEIKRELEETDAVLGDPDAVRRFVLNSGQCLGLEITKKADNVFVLGGLEKLPEQVRASLKNGQKDLKIAFHAPAPENAILLGRNHPLVAAFAQYLVEESLTLNGSAHAPRCGVVRTGNVVRRTILLLLRMRFSLHEPGRTSLLSEEAAVLGFRGNPPNEIEWLSGAEPMELLSSLSPESNISQGERREVLSEVLDSWKHIEKPLGSIMDGQAQKLLDSHRRVRAVAGQSRRGLEVSPHFPPDLLGVLTLIPVVKGVS